MRCTNQRSPIPPPAAPIDPSYKPKSSIVTVSATDPVDYILAVIARDGGVIIKDFVTKEELTSIDQELKDWNDNQCQQTKTQETRNGDAFHIIPPQTMLVAGLVGKSDTVVEICQNRLLEDIRNSILQDKLSLYREDWVEAVTIDPLLSLSLSMNIGYGAPRQRLHRDDNIHGMRHPKPRDWTFKDVSQIACLIAGCDVTRENGATMFVPGSHKWEHDTVASPDEVCFAGERVQILLGFRKTGSC